MGLSRPQMAHALHRPRPRCQAFWQQLRQRQRRRGPGRRAETPRHASGPQRPPCGGAAALWRAIARCRASPQAHVAGEGVVVPGRSVGRPRRGWRSVLGVPLGFMVSAWAWAPRDATALARGFPRPPPCASVAGAVLYRELSRWPTFWASVARPAPPSRESVCRAASSHTLRMVFFRSRRAQSHSYRQSRSVVTMVDRFVGIFNCATARRQTLSTNPGKRPRLGTPIF